MGCNTSVNIQTKEDKDDRIIKINENKEKIIINCSAKEKDKTSNNNNVNVNAFMNNNFNFYEAPIIINNMGKMNIGNIFIIF